MSHIKAYQTKGFFFYVSFFLPRDTAILISEAVHIIFTALKAQKRALEDHSSQVSEIKLHLLTQLHEPEKKISELTCSEAVVWACGWALSWAPMIPA